MAAKTFQLTVLSAERELYSGDAVSLTLPTETGEITVLADHLPLVSNLSAGEMAIKKEKGEDWLFVGGGVIEINSDNEVRVLADTVERADEIDEKAAQAARERAEKELEATASGPEEAAAKAALLHAIARLRIAEKRRRRK